MSKKLWLCLMLPILVGLSALAYDTINSHPNLTRAAIQVYNTEAANQITAEQAGWLVTGAIAEDASPRYLNHYYNPEINKGLGDHHTAKDWALTGGWYGITGDFSEPEIMANYQNGNYQRAYEGVGHIVHLLQDMAVPAHVRLESHPWGDYYEQWVQNNGQVISGPKIEVSDLGVAFDQLSSYTHDNFYSLNTIDGNVQYDEIYKAPDQYGDLVDFAYKNGRKLVMVKYVSGRKILSFDQTINPDYWQQLSPKAVGYSAGVIEYFQKKFTAIDQTRPKTSSWQTLTNYSLGNMVASAWQGANYSLNDFLVTPEEQAVELAVISTVQTGMTVGTQVDNLAQRAAVKLNNITAATPAVTPIINSVKLVAPTANTPTPKITIAQAPVVNPIKPSVLGVKIAQAAPVIEPPVVEPSAAINIKSSNEPLFTNTASQPITQYPFMIVSGGNLGGVQLPVVINPPVENAKSEVLVDEGEPVVLATTSEPVIDVPVTESTSTEASSSQPVASSGVELIISTSAEEIIVFPETFIVQRPPLVTSSTLTWLSVDSDQANASFEYDIDSSGWTPMGAKDIVLTLPEGQHGFKARAAVQSATTTIYDPTPAEYQWTIDQTPDHLVISAVQLAGAVANDEWVELYNPTNTDIALANYKLKRKSQSGTTEYNLVVNFGAAIIKAKSYYLITHPTDYTGEIVPDIVYGSVSYGLSPDNTLILYDGTSTIDKLGLGLAVERESASCANPSANQAAVRKASALSTSESLSSTEQYQGHRRDTDNNQDDFVVLVNYQPHSSDSAAEPTSAAPLLPAKVNLMASTTSTSSTILNWLAPNNGLLGEGAKYEFRYQVKGASCNLNINWRTASSAIITNTPLAEGATESYVLNGLLGGVNYCVAIRTFNGQSWSLISNQLELRTRCLDGAPLHPLYYVRYLEASNTTVATQTPEKIMAFDLRSGSDEYDILLPKACGWLYGYPYAYIGGQWADRTFVELVYNPTTKKFTGEFRYCNNSTGWPIYNLDYAGRCLDANYWGGKRWQFNANLTGESMVAIKAVGANKYTAWQELK